MYKPYILLEQQRSTHIYCMHVMLFLKQSLIDKTQYHAYPPQLSVLINTEGSCELSEGMFLWPDYTIIVIQMA